MDHSTSSPTAADDYDHNNDPNSEYYNYGGSISDYCGNETSGLYPYDYYDAAYGYCNYSYGNDIMYNNNIYFYKGFDFERPVYLYIWVALIILTTLANILVMIVLQRKNMRNATNIILIAVAISDSLTGLVTLPVTVHAYQQYVAGDLALTKEWCLAFMVIRYFVSRSFHTMSIWLTVVLGFQRLISVLFPFRAQIMFSIRKTLVIILIVMFLSPFLHIYHAFDNKLIEHPGGGGSCEWKVETPCKESCVYLWLVILLMHFIPCLMLTICTAIMVNMMRKTTKKMKDSQMIANKANLHRRSVESKRITCIVVAVVIVFLIPEIPYGVFLMVQLSLKHSGKRLLLLKTSREIICAYEILLVLSFQANFWIYLIMNRRFRKGLARTFEPLEFLTYCLLGKFGVKRLRTRRRSDSTSIGRTFSDAPSVPSQTAHSRLSQSLSSAPLEMRTYHFKAESNANGVHQDKQQSKYIPVEN